MLCKILNQRSLIPYSHLLNLSWVSLQLYFYIMSDFFEVLLYIIIGFWILRLLLRWALPYLLKYFVKYAAKKAENQFHQNRQNPFDSNTRSHTKQKKEKSDDKVGEYIDYEEID